MHIDHGSDIQTDEDKTTTKKGRKENSKDSCLQAQQPHTGRQHGANPSPQVLQFPFYSTRHTPPAARSDPNGQWAARAATLCTFLPPSLEAAATYVPDPTTHSQAPRAPNRPPPPTDRPMSNRSGRDWDVGRCPSQKQPSNIQGWKPRCIWEKEHPAGRTPQRRLRIAAA